MKQQQKRDEEFARRVKAIQAEHRLTLTGDCDEHGEVSVTKDVGQVFQILFCPHCHRRCVVTALRSG